MNDVRGDFLGPPHGTTPAAVIANNPLEAVKTFQRRKYGLYCAISDNEPSSVALLNPATKARLLYFNFEKFTREV